MEELSSESPTGRPSLEARGSSGTRDDAINTVLDTTDGTVRYPRDEAGTLEYSKEEEAHLGALAPEWEEGGMGPQWDREERCYSPGEQLARV